MNTRLLQDTCEKLAGLIKRFGKMSLNDAKFLYNQENGLYPLAKDSDSNIHSFLIDIGGTKFDADTEEYFFEKDLSSNGKQSTFFSPAHTSTSKRSRSAPDNDENKENFEAQRPRREPKIQRRNSAWAPRHPAISLKRSRSTPDLEDLEDGVQNKQKRFLRNEPERQSRYGRFQNDDERATPRSSRSKSEHQPNVTDLAQFQNCVLIGDDFLLGFAMLELREQAKRSGGLLQSGLCWSGMTISMATNKLRGLKNPQFERILVYLGSFDIIDGKELIEMINDFDEFVNVCKRSKIKAVACTLAPLPLHESGNRRETLKGFNKYLRILSKLSVIDINKVFLGANNYYNERCYGDKMRKVSGSTRMLMLWSDYGRFQFKGMVMRNLGMALLDDKSFHDK